MDYEDRIRAFENDLTHLINKYSLENRSNTPDHILAKYLVMSLVCLDHAIGVRDVWYGGATKQKAAPAGQGWHTASSLPPEPVE